ncbi:MAG: bacteriohemerythrin [Alphaproteobacteria bacterium]|nr:bacteriohemerythrin [Alphaproteobacteria bacterium]
MAAPRLLVIDDDAIICKIIAKIGEDAGFAVDTCLRSRDFQSKIREYTPNVMIIDMVIPHMDGIELLQWLDGEKCHAPVILISGYGDGYLDAGRTIGLARGVNIAATLKKPLDASDLKATLANLLAIEFMEAQAYHHAEGKLLPSYNKLPGEMLTGSSEMDADHLRLFQLIGDYHTAVANGCNLETVHEVLRELDAYTKIHFHREEAYMRDHGYPQAANHAQVHRLLCGKVEKLADAPRENWNSALEKEFMVFLWEWLYSHIMSMDKKYARWVAKRAAGASPP